MFKITESNGNVMYDVVSYVCDTQEDIKKLPTNHGMGSNAFVISTSEIYMLNSNQEWVKI